MSARPTPCGTLPASCDSGAPYHHRSIALAETHETETGQEQVLDLDFAADVEEIIRNRKPRNPPTWD